MYVAAMERLETAGYEQYEISNVARPGHRARHNLKYWTDGEWRGFGCGAHSTIGGVRWKNRSVIDWRNEFDAFKPKLVRPRRTAHVHGLPFAGR